MAAPVVQEFSHSMRIVLATFGTFGDVNPLIGIALELKRRGHTAAIAAPEMFRAKVEPLGLGFFRMRPDQDPSDKALVAMIYDIKRGTERGLREFLFPALRESYEDLMAAVQADGGADLLMTGELAYAGPIVAEVTGVPWVSYVLAPFSFFSAWDPPVLPPYPMLARAQAVVPKTGHLVRPFARWVTRSWCEPVYALRQELGLPPGRNPLFEAKFSPRLVLALFSKVLGEPQPDWPANTQISGFVFYDGAGARESAGAGAGESAGAGAAGSASALAPELEAFLQAGPPPLVFTLGSAAVYDPGDFYDESARAAEALGMRAVLLVGPDPSSQPRQRHSPDVITVNFAPFSALFPRASLIVHQGGVGTTAQALRAGKPMLIMPYSHDQPDNARRMRRLGVAKVISRTHYNATRAARKIGKLLGKPAYSARAARAARIIAAEDGLAYACDALEAAGR
jgi:UDP:flavonoid glycosyltransferase YjiC (YdhE family)